MADKNLDENAVKVLGAFKTIGENTSPKAVAEITGLDSKIVTKVIKVLKDEGLVDSPVRCKYCITAEGKNRV